MGEENTTEDKEGGQGKGVGIFSKNKKSLEGSKQRKAIFKGF